MKDRVYRRCHTCGRTWNVSCLDPGGKHYTCPRCEGKQKGPLRSQPTKAPAQEANITPKGAPSL